MRFSVVEILFGLLAIFTLGFTVGMVMHQLVYQDTAACEVSR